MRKQKHSTHLKRKQNIAAAGERCTRSEWESLCAFYAYRCLCCGAKKHLTKDHIIPLGYPGCSNSIDNLQPLCEQCNTYKNKDVIDFRYNVSSLIPWISGYLELPYRSWIYSGGLAHFCIKHRSICGGNVSKRALRYGVKKAVKVPTESRCPRCTSLLERAVEIGAYKEVLVELKSQVGLDEYDFLEYIFSGVKWVDKSTQEPIRIHPMSSWGYQTKGPGSISIYYPEDHGQLSDLQEKDGRSRSFKVKEFLDNFEIKR
jgi:hypothetical protein